MSDFHYINIISLSESRENPKKIDTTEKRRLNTIWILYGVAVSSMSYDHLKRISPHKPCFWSTLPIYSGEIIQKVGYSTMKNEMKNTFFQDKWIPYSKDNGYRIIIIIKYNPIRLRIKSSLYLMSWEKVQSRSWNRS